MVASVVTANDSHDGDRLHNDLGPAAHAGLRTVFVKRGPWVYIIYQPGSANLEFDSLAALPDALKKMSTN